MVAHRQMDVNTLIMCISEKILLKFVEQRIDTEREGERWRGGINCWLLNVSGIFHGEICSLGYFCDEKKTSHEQVKKYAFSVGNRQTLLADWKKNHAPLPSRENEKVKFSHRENCNENANWERIDGESERQEIRSTIQRIRSTTISIKYTYFGVYISKTERGKREKKLRSQWLWQRWRPWRRRQWWRAEWSAIKMIARNYQMGCVRRTASKENKRQREKKNIFFFIIRSFVIFIN